MLRFSGSSSIGLIFNEVTMDITITDIITITGRRKRRRNFPLPPPSPIPRPSGERERVRGRAGFIIYETFYFLYPGHYNFIGSRLSHSFHMERNLPLPGKPFKRNTPQGYSA